MWEWHPVHSTSTKGPSHFKKNTETLRIKFHSIYLELLFIIQVVHTISKVNRILNFDTYIYIERERTDAVAFLTTKL